MRALVILAALQLLDCGTTCVAYTLGGTELNPLMAALLAEGLWVFVAFKLLGAALAISFLHRERPRVVWLVNALMAVVVLNNFLAIGTLL